MILTCYSRCYKCLGNGHISTSSQSPLAGMITVHEPCDKCGTWGFHKTQYSSADLRNYLRVDGNGLITISVMIPAT